MSYASLVILAAKKVGVSSSLLLAICSHESNLKNVYVKHDGGSPSIGICQIKESTAKMLGFDGDEQDLMIPYVNAKWAAEYVKWQLKRYDHDWCKTTSAYNAGSYTESKVVPGFPRNLKYVRKVQKRIDIDLQHKLSCIEEDLAKND